MTEDGITTSAAALPGGLAYEPNWLRSFSIWATASVVAGLVLAGTSAATAVGYAVRIDAIHDFAEQTATVADVDNAYQFVRWMLYVNLAVIVAWIVTLLRLTKWSYRLVGIGEQHEVSTRRRLFKQVLERSPDWTMYKRCQTWFSIYAVLWVLLRFAIPTPDTGTLAHLVSVNRRSLIIESVYVVLTLVISVLGWRAKRAVEAGVVRSMA